MDRGGVKKQLFKPLVWERTNGLKRNDIQKSLSLVLENEMQRNSYSKTNRKCPQIKNHDVFDHPVIYFLTQVMLEKQMIEFIRVSWLSKHIALTSID